MAGCARRGECRRDVVRIGYVRIVRLVTRIAIGRSAGITPADMAAGARDLDMCARKRERRVRVVERRWLPRCRVVTDSAVGWKRGRDVVRRFRAVEIVLVAREAGRAQPRIFTARVARHAGQRDVRSRQRELRLRVIEFGPGPSRGRMAD